MTGDLFAPGAPSRPARRRNPPKQTTVTITAEAIAAVTAARMMVKASSTRQSAPRGRTCATSPWISARSAGPIRKAGKRVTFRTPDLVRYALIAMTRGDRPEPFRFILGRAARVTRDGN